MQCLLHWRYALNEDQQVRGIGSWSVEEDARLKALVTVHGCKWALVARSMPGRVAKQCRERYLNHLDPKLQRGPWTPEEEQVLLRLCEGQNRQWAEICRQLPGRSYNDVKNRYNLIQRRLKRASKKAAAAAAGAGGGALSNAEEEGPGSPYGSAHGEGSSSDQPPSGGGGGAQGAAFGSLG
ncbi:Homeodomain-like protein [Tribonema minus]|uniref:Homeodomain-like protein n=1 Tax=Tribonema minus TaxID=303371 RepID=A0A836CND7_9STRA|nr:Homeodomain-like protein [Tribonema minus]